MTHDPHRPSQPNDDNRPRRDRFGRGFLCAAAGVLGLIAAPLSAEIQQVGNGTIWEHTVNLSPLGLTFTYESAGELYYYWDPEPEINKGNAIQAFARLHETEPFWPAFKTYIDGDATVTMEQLVPWLEESEYWPWKQQWDVCPDDADASSGVSGWAWASHTYSGVQDGGFYLRYFIHGPSNPYINDDWPECFMYKEGQPFEARHWSVQRPRGAPEPQPACEPQTTTVVHEIRCDLNGISWLQTKGHWETQTNVYGAPLEAELQSNWEWYELFAGFAEWSWGHNNLQAFEAYLPTVYLLFDPAEPIDKIYPAVLVEGGSAQCEPWECSRDPWVPPEPDPVDPTDPTDPTDPSDPSGGGGGEGGWEWPCIPLWQNCAGYTDAGQEITGTELDNVDYDIQELMDSHDSRAGQGQCPEDTEIDILLPDFADKVSFEWELICDTLHHAEPWIKILAGIMAFAIVLGGFGRF